MADIKTIWLVKRFFKKETSVADEDVLADWVRTHSDEEIGEVLAIAYEDYEAPDPTPETIASLEKVEHRLKAYINSDAVIPMQRTRRSWLPYAAAVALLLTVGGYFYITQKEKPLVTQIKPNPVNAPGPVKTDIAPGGNRATLTLADGKTIMLDSANTGTIAQQGTSTISKLRDGELAYLSDKAADPVPATNVLTTPRGGQYKVKLPDGSLVWLNAASSITYPTAFTGEERRVKVTGEAYFEVMKNKNPFIVDIPGEASVIVMGTHFNVNAYPEEMEVITTLIEGSVRLVAPRTGSRPQGSSGSGDSKLVLTSLTLKPGQQGVLTVKGGPVSNRHRLTLASSPDVNQVVAWKNGVFDFNNVTLTAAMRQLSRWYDVEVEYAGAVPDIKFGGKIGRDLNLSEVLNGLQALGVKLTLKDKTIVVTP